MREIKQQGDFKAYAIAGTRVVMVALDCTEERRKGLLGFAFWRQGGAGPGKWLRSLKVFRSVVPDPRALIGGKPPRFTTEDHPIQSFLWSDYTAEPNTLYRFKIVPIYGSPKNLKPSDTDAIEIEIRTEKEFDKGHGIWFNRGAIASQAFAREFGDIKPSSQQLDDPTQKVTKWLSRGLLEACKQFIEETPASDCLRVCAYEFTYKPILNALKAALDRGVDVQIVFHDTKANGEAIKAAELPQKKGNRQVLFSRTKPQIPHNKFIIRLDKDEVPRQVWTGSTNLTPSGFLGQTNVGHLIDDGAAAEQYLKYWTLVAKDPDAKQLRTDVMKLTPHPLELLKKKSAVVVFSPRANEAMLFWYANRISDAASAVMFTAAFGVNATLRTPLAKDRDFLRFILMESAPNAEEKKTFAQDRDLIISFGAVLGETKVYKDGKFETVRLKNFGLDKWFEQEEHYRKQGNIFFVHTKFLLIDPLSDDPLVCTGSANFSKGSLVNNDENMILIRGGTRVADIYMTEFDRIFRHFYFRDVANEIEKKGGEAEGAFLKEDDSWTETYFKPGYFKCRRREMFFSKPAPTWPENAAVWKLGASEEAYALFHAEELAMNRKKRAAKKAASTAPATKRTAVSVKKRAAKKAKKAKTAKMARKAPGSGRR